MDMAQPRPMEMSETDAEAKFQEIFKHRFTLGPETVQREGGLPLIGTWVQMSMDIHLSFWRFSLGFRLHSEVLKAN